MKNWWCWKKQPKQGDGFYLPRSPISGASVTGTFSGDFNEITRGITDAAGVAVIQTTVEIKKSVYEFCVDNVDEGSLAYTPEDNLENCDTNLNMDSS